MATTTNYGWTTPDDTALVKDGAAAIRTLGSSVDTTTKALNPSTTLGDIEYRSSTANTNTRLPIGTTGQLLKVVGGVPAWADPAGGGKVLQVVQASTTTSTTITSQTFTDTNLSASITPSAATSKILIQFAQICSSSGSGNEAKTGIRLLRNSTSVYEPGATGQESQYIYANGASSVDIKGIVTGIYLDSPATTSSTTYKTQLRVGDVGDTGTLNGAISTIILMEIGV